MLNAAAKKVRQYIRSQMTRQRIKRIYVLLKNLLAIYDTFPMVHRLSCDRMSVIWLPITNMVNYLNMLLYHPQSVYAYSSLLSG
jgi:hypothetical protein